MDARVAEVLQWLERRGSRRNVLGVARYGIRTERRMLGVSMATMFPLAKRLGKDHALAAAPWQSGCYEAAL